MATTVFVFGIPDANSDLEESLFNKNVQSSILDWLIRETGKKDWNLEMMKPGEPVMMLRSEGELTVVVEGPGMTPPKMRLRRNVIRGKYRPRYMGERYPYKAQKELLELRELSGNPNLSIDDYYQSTPVERYDFDWKWCWKHH